MKPDLNYENKPGPDLSRLPLEILYTKKITKLSKSTLPVH